VIQPLLVVTSSRVAIADSVLASLSVLARAVAGAVVCVSGATVTLPMMRPCQWVLLRAAAQRTQRGGRGAGRDRRAGRCVRVRLPGGGLGEEGRGDRRLREHRTDQGVLYSVEFVTTERHDENVVREVFAAQFDVSSPPALCC